MINQAQSTSTESALNEYCRKWWDFLMAGEALRRTIATEGFEHGRLYLEMMLPASQGHRAISHVTQSAFGTHRVITATFRK